MSALEHPAGDATRRSACEEDSKAPTKALRRLREIGAELASGISARRIKHPQDDTADAAASDAKPLEQWRTLTRRAFMGVALFSVFVNILMLTMPIYLFQISDRVLTSRSSETLLLLSLLALGLIATMSVLEILRRQLLSRLSISMETLLGGPVLASIVTSAPTGAGGNVAALKSLHQTRAFLSSPTMLLLFDAPLAPFYFAVIFLIHPTLGYIVLVAGILLAAIALFNQAATAVPFSTSSAFAARADAQADSLARNAQVINAMGMMRESIQHWGRDEAPALTQQVRANDRNFWISGSSKFARLVTQIAILGVGAHLALASELTGGMMIAASIIAGRALQPIEGMIEGWRGLIQARAAYARVRTALDAYKSQQPKLLLPRPKGRITVERTLYIPPGTKEPVINGLNFELMPGESLAIVGPSGSGKSTLARLLVGCIYPTAGNIRLDGTEVRNWDRRQFGECIGYLPQEVELFPGTIKENICRLNTALPDEEIFSAAAAAGVHEMVCQLAEGYETTLDRNGAPLSGGQKQRIALARVFYGNPAFIVLDEPNSNLDSAGEAALAESMKAAKARGVTTVIITQRPALLNTVDKVLILRGGRMEAFGPPREVLHRLVQAAGIRENRADVSAKQAGEAS